MNPRTVLKIGDQIGQKGGNQVGQKIVPHPDQDPGLFNKDHHLDNDGTCQRWNGTHDSGSVDTDETDEEYQKQHQLSESASVSQRLHTQCALHALTHDETTTFRTMLSRDEKAEVFVMPNHRIDEAGNLRGFRLVVDKHSDCVHLPITREMFKGSTCVECDPVDKDIHPDVIRLLSSTDDVKKNILAMLSEIGKHSMESMVGMDNMPIYGDTESVAVSADDNCTGKERSEILLENLISDRIGHHSTTMRGRDSRAWKCDMPNSIGVYHAHVRSRDSGRRHHKLFIIVEGGCRRASEQFYNLNLDLFGNATAGELESCEESWWLRRTSTRSRCMTAQIVADALKLQVPTAGDVFNFDNGVSIPVFTTDTLSHDISETDDGRVAMFNECCDSTRMVNGSICTQFPMEGDWIFQGSQQSSIGTLTNFGSVFGHQERCGAFPTGTFSIHKGEYQHSSNTLMTNRNISANDCDSDEVSHNKLLHDTRLNLYKEKPCNHVVYFNPLNGEEVTDIDFDSRPHFVKMDEAFLKHLEKHDWKREYQVIQLIPIINCVETCPIVLQS